MLIKDTTTFGKIIRQYRKKQGLTQVQLAAMANTSPRLIGELENGKTTIQLEKALKVAWLLGVSFSVPDKD